MLSGKTAARRCVLLAAGVTLCATSLNPSLAETTTYQYDALGRLLAATQASGSAVAYDYDKAGNRTRVGGLAVSGPVVSISANSLTQNEGNSGSTSFLFSVARSGPLAAPFSVGWTAAGSGGNPVSASDFVGSVLPSGTVSFAAAEAGPKTILVSVAGDTIVEQDEEFTVTLSNLVGGAIGVVSASQLILNDDATMVVVANYDTASTADVNPITFDPRVNDTGGSLTITGATQPFAGGVVSYSSGAITFTPTVGFQGAAAFTYTVSNGVSSATGNISISVGRPPVAATDTVSAPYQTSVSFDPRSNDSGAGPLTITAVGQPGHGSRTFSGNSVSYTPSAGFSGADTFSYAVSNAYGSTAGSIVVNVSSTPPPTAVNDQLVALQELLIPEVGPWWGHGCVDVLANDSGANKTLVSVAPSQTAAGGLPTIANGQVCYDVFDYVPASDTFTYTMSGDGGTSTATVTVSFTFQ